MKESASETTSTQRRSYLSIREVLDLLLHDFPDVTISKIRFLESRGLIHPERTPSGYRKFYKADVDRLRWILRQQREHYLPLNVIKVRLDGAEGDLLGSDSDTSAPPSLFDTNGYTHEATVDATSQGAQIRDIKSAESNGAEPIGWHPSQVQPPSPSPKVAPAEKRARPTQTVIPAAETVPDEELTPVVAAPASTQAANEPRGRFTISEIAAQASTNDAFIFELESFGLIAGVDVAGVHCFDEQALAVAQLASTFMGFGIQPRHLKSLQHAALREADLFAQVVTPLLRQRNPDARLRAEGQLSELVNLGESLKSAFVSNELRHLTGG